MCKVNLIALASQIRAHGFCQEGQKATRREREKLSGSSGSPRPFETSDVMKRLSPQQKGDYTSSDTHKKAPGTVARTRLDVRSGDGNV